MRHHLVIVREPYLKLMLSGRKKIECRLSSSRRPPYEAVSPGDLLWLKLPSRPICALARVGDVKYGASRDSAELVRWVQRHRREILAEDAFYKDAAAWARYASLIRLELVLSLRPVPVAKSDQRAWVVMKSPPTPGQRIGRASVRKARAKQP